MKSQFLASLKMLKQAPTEGMKTMMVMSNILMFFIDYFESYRSASIAARSAVRRMLLFGGLFADRQGTQPNIQPMSPQSEPTAPTCVSAERPCLFAAQLAYRQVALFHRPAVLLFRQPLTSTSGDHFSVP